MAIATLTEKRDDFAGKPADGGNTRKYSVSRRKRLEKIKLAIGEELRIRNEVWYRVFFQETVGRWSYWAVHMVAFAGMVFLILDATIVYTDSPTLTTMESDSYPARDVDFPGVAICSTNKMSDRAVNELALELYHMETTKIFNVTLGQIKDMLKHLGHLYVFDVERREIEEAQLLHAILSRAYGDYNVVNLMIQLNPKCRYLLKYCSWEGMDHVCDNLFFIRKTQDGFCCTFNYARRNDYFGSAKRSGFVSSMVEKSTVINPEFGLKVILNSASDDYFYKSTPSNGFKILLFSPLDYPDLASGSLQEIWVPQKSDVFIALEARSFHTMPDVVEYDVSSRNCLFNTEQNKIFQGYYSYSDCIMYCRIRYILRLCNCIPFFYPHSESARSCSLDDLMCLKEVIVKWRQVKPPPNNKGTSFNIFDTEMDSKEHLNCDCFPSCDDVVYKITSSQIPLTANKILWDRQIIRNKNYSILHIYFDGPNTIRLKQDVLFYWYELMSEYGGICSLFLGVSIINVIEIMYGLLQVALNRGRGGVIDRSAAGRDIVGRLQDAKDAAPPSKLGLVQNAAPRLNSVKVIDVGPPVANATQLYWQEFVKPRNKPVAMR